MRLDSAACLVLELGRKREATPNTVSLSPPPLIAEVVHMLQQDELEVILRGDGFLRPVLAQNAPLLRAAHALAVSLVWVQGVWGGAREWVASPLL